MKAIKVYTVVIEVQGNEDKLTDLVRERLEEEGEKTTLERMFEELAEDVSFPNKWWLWEIIENHCVADALEVSKVEVKEIAQFTGDL